VLFPREKVYTKTLNQNSDLIIFLSFKSVETKDSVIPDFKSYIYPTGKSFGVVKNEKYKINETTITTKGKEKIIYFFLSEFSKKVLSLIEFSSIYIGKLDGASAFFDPTLLSVGV
jgi:hypothetical protein